MVVAPESLASLSAEQLRNVVTALMLEVGEHAKAIASKDREILYRQTKIDQLTHEMAVLKRLASLDAAASSSIRPKLACSMRPLMLTSRRSRRSCKRSHLSH